jgi:hypothetical protein
MAVFDELFLETQALKHAYRTSAFEDEPFLRKTIRLLQSRRAFSEDLTTVGLGNAAKIGILSLAGSDAAPFRQDFNRPFPAL